MGFVFSQVSSSFTPLRFCLGIKACCVWHGLSVSAWRICYKLGGIFFFGSLLRRHVFCVTDAVGAATPGKLIESTFPDDLETQANIFQNSALEFLGLEKERFLPNE